MRCILPILLLALPTTVRSATLFADADIARYDRVAVAVDSAAIDTLAADTLVVKTVRTRRSAKKKRSSDQYAGYFVVLHLGVRPPFSQVPVLGNEAGIEIGARFGTYFAALLHYGYSGLLEYSGDPSYEMAATRCDYSVDLRYYPFPPGPTGGRTRPYGLVNLGYATFTSDGMRDRHTYTDIPNSSFSQGMISTGIGLGLSMTAFYLEFRREFGLAKLRFVDRNGGPVERSVVNTVVRWGLHFEM